MHLKNVELFCDIVTRQSFSKAADANNVSQSAASQAVHALEKKLGTRLIDRSKRPFQLTSAGKVYFDGVRNLLESFREVEDQVQRLENKVTGRLRVAAIYSVGLLQMDTYVRQYHELYPDVELQLEYLHPDEVYDRVINDDAELGLVSFPRDGGEIGSILWQEQKMVLVTSPEHRLAEQKSVSVRELERENFVGFRSELTIRRQIDRWLKRAKVNVNIVHEFDSIENIKRAVEIGSGVAILPVPTVRREVKLGSLTTVGFNDVEWYRPLGVIHKRHKKFTTPVTKFVELLHEDPETFPHSRSSDAVSANGNGATNSRKHHTKSNGQNARRKSKAVLSEQLKTQSAAKTNDGK